MRYYAENPEEPINHDWLAGCIRTDPDDAQISCLKPEQDEPQTEEEQK